MKKPIWFVMIVMLLGVMVLAACGGSGGGATVSRAEPPADYGAMTNPYSGNADAANTGKDLFALNCASCHGDTGKGDGPAAAALDPKPRNLTDSAANASDAYIHWVITEGGPAAGLSSSMPGFKGVLNDDQTWQIVTFIKTLE